MLGWGGVGVGIALEFDAGLGCARACLGVDVVRCSTILCSCNPFTRQCSECIVLGRTLVRGSYRKRRGLLMDLAYEVLEHDIATGLKVLLHS